MPLTHVLYNFPSSFSPSDSSSFDFTVLCHNLVLFTSNRDGDVCTLKFSVCDMRLIRFVCFDASCLRRSAAAVRRASLVVFV